LSFFDTIPPQKLDTENSRSRHVNVAPVPTPVAMPERASAITGSSLIIDSLDDYRKYLSSAHKKESTIGLFTADIRKLAGFLPNNLPVGQIGINDLRGFVDDCRRKGDRPKTLDRRISAVRNYFKWLFNDQVIRDNPAAALIFPRAVPPLPKILSRDEVAAFLSAAKASDEDHLITILFLGAGLKRSEALSLTAQSIKIEDSLRPPVLTVSGTERTKDRNLNLPLTAIECCRRYLSTRLPQDSLLSMGKRKLNEVVTEIGKRAAVTGRAVTCQLLRDTFAVQLLRSGKNIDDILAALGLVTSSANDEIKNKYMKLLELYP
jgi:site-specific recombinase XerD